MKNQQQPEEQNERGNNTLALGGVFAALTQTGVVVERADDDQSLVVRLPFLKCAYRLTVRRIAGSEAQPEGETRQP